MHKKQPIFRRIIYESTAKNILEEISIKLTGLCPKKPTRERGQSPKIVLGRDPILHTFILETYNNWRMPKCNSVLQTEKDLFNPKFDRIYALFEPKMPQKCLVFPC